MVLSAQGIGFNGKTFLILLHLTMSAEQIVRIKYLKYLSGDN
jgi:hypothetical protein